MVTLITVAHEAVVTGGLAVFLHASGTVAVLTRVGIEVAEVEGLAGDRRKGTRLFDETPQHAGAAFGGFIEQQGSAVVNGRQGFGSKLVLLELVDDLNGVLECRLQACHDLIALVGIHRVEGGFQKEAVAAVLDVGDDLLLHGGHGILGVLVLRHQLVALPVATFGVEHEAVDIGVLTAAPAEIDAPDGGGLSVGHGAEDRAVLLASEPL